MITLPEIIERDKRPPSVTVYMICYNHEKYLDEAMHGVLMQKTNFPVNIVVHDDASTDRSGEIIRRYASENPNMTAIIEETNYYQNGKSFFPKVLPYLTGKYIAWCECDDFWLDENKLQIQVDYLETHPDCSAVYSNTLPVNKYSQHDEKIRVFFKTGEGYYPSWKLFNATHQLASCVTRNFWQFMTAEEINLYLNTKDNGDEKNIAICLGLGKVYHFRREFAAYRFVTDEGDSFSARMRKKNKYELFCYHTARSMETYRMIETLFSKKYSRKYLYLLFREFLGRIAFRRSVINDVKVVDLKHYYDSTPWYIWAAFPFYFPYGVWLKILYRIRRFKYKYLSF